MSALTRMFKLDGDERIETWNPCKGCIHGCYRGKCKAAYVTEKLQQQGRATAYSARVLDGTRETGRRFSEERFCF